MRHGRIEDFPPQLLGERRDLALLFKRLATLRTDAALFTDVDELYWRGPTPEHSAACVAILKATRSECSLGPEKACLFSACPCSTSEWRWQFRRARELTIPRGAA